MAVLQNSARQRPLCDIFFFSFKLSREETLETAAKESASSDDFAKSARFFGTICATSLISKFSLVFTTSS